MSIDDLKTTVHRDKEKEFIDSLVKIRDKCNTIRFYKGDEDIYRDFVYEILQDFLQLSPKQQVSIISVGMNEVFVHWNKNRGLHEKC